MRGFNIERNAEGYTDPTAFEALKSTARDQRIPKPGEVWTKKGNDREYLVLAVHGRFSNVIMLTDNEQSPMQIQSRTMRYTNPARMRYLNASEYGEFIKRLPETEFKKVLSACAAGIGCTYDEADVVRNQREKLEEYARTIGQQADRIIQLEQELGGNHSITMDEYASAAMRTDSTHDTVMLGLINAALGLCGEAGEVADLIKKWVFQGAELDTEHLAKEVGDCLWYNAQLSKYLGVPMSKVAQMNIDKLRKRYKNGFTVDESNNRAADDV